MGIRLSGISIRCGIGLMALATCFAQTVVGLMLGRVALKDGYLYTVDEDAEGLFSIAKYEIR